MRAMAKLITGAYLTFLSLGVVGIYFDDLNSINQNIKISLLIGPLIYLTWLTWKSLNISHGDAKFYLAHVSPGTMIALGIIPLGVPNKIPSLVIGGLIFIACGVLVIREIHKQRKKPQAQQ